MNVQQSLAFCSMLRRYVVAQDSMMCSFEFDMALGFRMCYGVSDDCDQRVYERMCALTDAAIDARLYIGTMEDR